MTAKPLLQYLLHENVRKYGTICNTVAGATSLSGTMRRAEAHNKTGGSDG
jgi:hypothetical protein